MRTHDLSFFNFYRTAIFQNRLGNETPVKSDGKWTKDGGYGIDAFKDCDATYGARSHGV